MSLPPPGQHVYTPTPSDPLGLLARPIEDALARLVDERIANAWRGKAAPDFNNTPDVLLCMELISRGWVVYKPQPPAQAQDETR